MDIYCLLKYFASNAVRSGLNIKSFLSPAPDSVRTSKDFSFSNQVAMYDRLKIIKQLSKDINETLGLPWQS